MQLELSEAFPERNTMVLAGQARSGSPRPPPGGGGGGGGGGIKGAGSQKVWVWGSLARWGWPEVTESAPKGSSPSQPWKLSEGHAKGQGIKGDMAGASGVVRGRPPPAVLDPDPNSLPTGSLAPSSRRQVAKCGPRIMRVFYSALSDAS